MTDQKTKNKGKGRARSLVSSLLVLAPPPVTETEREHSLERERYAYFDLIRPDAFVEFVNCAPINTVSETDTILETITIPFNNS